MRVRIVLQPISPSAFLPLNNHPFAALIYSSIKAVDEQYAKSLHNQGYLLDDSSTNKQVPGFKPFVFSRPQVSGVRIKDNRLYFSSSDVVWQVSSPIERLMECFIEGLKGQPVIKLHLNQLSSICCLFRINKIETIAPPKFTTDRVRFVAISPITALSTSNDESKQYSISDQKYYFRAEEDMFSQKIVEKLLENYQTISGKASNYPLASFEFDWQHICSKWGFTDLTHITDTYLQQQIKQKCSEKISKLVQYKEINIKAYQAPFFVTASPELLEFGWQCGFGMNNSQGFGMVQVG